MQLLNQTIHLEKKKIIHHIHGLPLSGYSLAYQLSFEQFHLQQAHLGLT
jgi:hypothetical protein